MLSLLSVTGDSSTREVVSLRNQIAKLYKQKNLQQALAFAEATIPIAEKANVPDLLTNAYASVADLANLTGDFKKGAVFADKTAKSMEHLNDSASQAKKFIVLMNKGGWISPLVSPEEKIAYGLKGLALYTKLKNEGGVATACTELGNAYKNKALYHSKGVAAEDSADFQRARDYFERAASYNRRVKNHPQFAYCLTIQAMMERQLGFNNKAYRLNKTAIQIYEREDFLLGAALPYAEISDLFATKKMDDSALSYINHSIDLYQQVGYKGNIDEFYDRRARIYEGMGDYKNALMSMRTAREARDQKYTAETARSIMEIETKYENKLKEEQIRTLSADKLAIQRKASQEKTIFWGIILIFISILAGLLVYLKQRQKILGQLHQKSILDKAITQTLETQLKHVQLQALQSQMNPHFIYNALSSIQGLILQEDKEKAIGYLNDFAQLSRLTLENSRKDNIKLKDEIIFLRRYLELETLRHNNRFIYSIEVEESIDTDFESIPPMLIQPVIENAIKHGFATKAGMGKLHVRFESDSEGNLICIVDDNGIGRSKASMLRNFAHNSMSTDINETRLQLIGEQEKMKKKYRIQIDDKFDENNFPAGTRVSIFFSTTSLNSLV